MPIPGRIGIFFCLALAVTYFPKASRPSIIGSVGLNYGVRNGNRCDPNDLATRNFIESLSLHDFYGPTSLAHLKVKPHD